MNREKRILVVEDNDSMRAQYVTSLELAGYSVDSVAALEDALEMIDAKTFHVALVDLMLEEATSTQYEGLDVLKKLQEVGEGTGALVISGQDSTVTAADTVTEYGAAKYLSKKQIISNGLPFVIEEVSQLLLEVNLKKYGKADDALPILAGLGENTAVWAYPLLNVLKPKEGANGLNRFLKHFSNPLAPLMPQREASPPLAMNQAERYASGRFWSKALGLPVELVICRSDETNTIVDQADNPLWATEPVVKPHDHFGLIGYVFGLPDTVLRSEFVATL